jgi:uncharacterized peroxidase-related enzyme
MARVRLVEETPTDAELNNMIEQIRRVEGIVPNHFKAELNFPELLKAMLNTTLVLWTRGELELKTLLMIGAVVSKENGCEYCVGAWGTWLTRAARLGRDEVYLLIRDWRSSNLPTERERKILEFALKVNSRWRDITDRDVEDLKELGLSDKGVVQIVHAVNNFAAYNKFNIALGVSPQHYDYEEIWSHAFHGK